MIKKIWLIAFVLLLYSTSSYSQKALEKRISISFEGTPLKKGLRQIEKVAQVSFAYQNTPVFDQKITAEFTNEKLKNILDKIGTPLELDYEIIADNILIFPIKPSHSAIEINRPKITISGHVYDSETGEVLIGCSIYAPRLNTGTITNNFGFFSLTLPAGKHQLDISYIGLNPEQITIDQSAQITVKLEPVASELGEIVVIAPNDDEAATTHSIGILKLKPEEIFSIPAIGGEVDVLKAITLLPGVKQGVDGSAGFYVRGGSPDQNLILLDDVPLYNPYHLWGFLSTFNPDAINNINLSKGAFPSRYGGRLSSVLDIAMKDGNNQKFKTNVSIGLLSAKVTISAPIVKNKSSLLISARRTFPDLILFPLMEKIINTGDYKSKLGYNFHDGNLKYNYKFSKNDRLYFSGFFGKDKVYQSSVYKNPHSSRQTEASNFKLGWSNLVASLRWNHLFGDKLFSNTTAYYSSYDYYADANKKTTYPNPEVNPNIEVALDYSSVIKDIAFKQDYQYFPNDRHLIRLGWSAIHHHFEPGITIYKAETGQQTISRTIKDNEVNALESAIYVEDNFELGERLKINAGLHTSGFFINKRKYFSLQPRLSATYSFDSKTSFKLGYAKMAQYMHLLTSSNILQATDLWVPSTDKVRPQRSNQVSAGAAFSLSNSYQLEVDLYYKKMKNLIEYIDGASFLSTASYLWEEKVTSGKGSSKGLEVFFKKKTGKLTGWISYTLAWANRTFKDINFGKTYPFRYDRRHDIAIVGSYQLSKKWTMNASWVFNSGNAVTIPITAYAGPDYDGQILYSGGIIPSNTTIDLNKYFTTNGIIENTVARNNYRLKPYHRMDITFSRTIKKKNSERIFTLGIINVYNRLNPSFYQKSVGRDINSTQLKIKYTATTLFPIMPTISYRRSF